MTIGQVVCNSKSLFLLASQKWNQQFSNQTPSPHNHPRCLLWYKPWKSDVSTIALPGSGTAQSSMCSSWQQHPANPSDPHMEHSGRWVMRGLWGQDGVCCEDNPPTYKEAIQVKWMVELFLSPEAELVGWRFGGFDWVVGENWGHICNSVRDRKRQSQRFEHRNYFCHKLPPFINFASSYCFFTPYLNWKFNFSSHF